MDRLKALNESLSEDVESSKDDAMQPSETWDAILDGLEDARSSLLDMFNNDVQLLNVDGSGLELRYNYHLATSHIILVVSAVEARFIVSYGDNAQVVHKAIRSPYEIDELRKALKLIAELKELKDSHKSRIVGSITS